LRFIADEQTVVDTRSGLIWMRDAGMEPFPMTWPEALACVREMNARKLFGCKEWRLPSRRELFSLISHSAVNPALPQGHPFVNVFNGYYWSGTTCHRLPDQAWYVHLGGARVFKGMKHGSYLVWPVRTAGERTLRVYRTGQQECYAADGSRIDCSGSGQDGDILSGQPWPQPRFADTDGSVIDRMTGLIWSRTAGITGQPVSWEQAEMAIAGANKERLHGSDNWRLPTIRELESLCDMGRHSPALPQPHPFEQVRDYYWSADTSRYDPRYAWALYLQDGAIGVGYKPNADFHVWPVRN
jgi:hypothetical protein